MTSTGADSAIDGDLLRLRVALVGLRRMACLRDPLAAACEQLQLTAPQLHVLLSLGHDAGLTMGELAWRGGVTEKTMTGVVDRLEQAGQVRRGRDAADRRVVRVWLTDLGQQTFAGADRQLTGRLRDFLSLLDGDDRAALLQVMEKLNARLAAAAAVSAEERR